MVSSRLMYDFVLLFYHATDILKRMSRLFSGNSIDLYCLDVFFHFPRRLPDNPYTAHVITGILARLEDIWSLEIAINRRFVSIQLAPIQQSSLHTDKQLHWYKQRAPPLRCGVDRCMILRYTCLCKNKSSDILTLVEVMIYRRVWIYTTSCRKVNNVDFSTPAKQI